jgi:hypothetical protein
MTELLLVGLIIERRKWHLTPDWVEILSGERLRILRGLAGESDLPSGFAPLTLTPVIRWGEASSEETAYPASARRNKSTRYSETSEHPFLGRTHATNPICAPTPAPPHHQRITGAPPGSAHQASQDCSGADTAISSQNARAPKTSAPYARPSRTPANASRMSAAPHARHPLRQRCRSRRLRNRALRLTLLRRSPFQPFTHPRCLSRMPDTGAWPVSSKDDRELGRNDG